MVPATLQLDGANFIRDLVSKETWVRVLKRLVEHVARQFHLREPLCGEAA